MFRKFLSLGVIFTFFLSTISPYSQAHADTVLNLPAPGTMINLSPAYQPVIIKGLTVHKNNPFLFDFIVDVGQDNLSGQSLKKEGEKLIKYFLASLAIPDKDLWVNLSPYEKNKMVPEALGQTDMGRDLLAQDYILKQITASLIYPEKQLGKTFWDRVYAKSQEMYGTTQVPVNTFNKVWIMADRAEVFEHNQTAFVVGQHLKVMLEEDYLALEKHSANASSSFNVIASEAKQSHSIASQIVREIVLPELEKEVNTGKNFANLRQIFNSIILSSWYKKNLREALLTQLYADKSTVKGINLNDPTVKQRIYEQYLAAYRKGVFNYIKEDVNSAGETIPRKYFSGGMEEGVAADPAMTTDPVTVDNAMTGDRLVDFSTLASTDAAMTMKEEAAIKKINSSNDIEELNAMIRNNGTSWKVKIAAKKRIGEIETLSEEFQATGTDRAMAAGLTLGDLNADMRQSVEQFVELFGWNMANVQILDKKLDLPRLLQEAVAEGETTGRFIQLADGNYFAQSNSNDTMRAPPRTFVSTNNPEDQGFHNNWKNENEIRDHIIELMKQDAKPTDTVYVLPYLRGPKGSPFSKVGVQITTDRQVAIQIMTLYKVGRDAVEHLNDSNYFTKGVNVPGDLEEVWGIIGKGGPDNRHFAAFLNRREFLSTKSAYGGNAILPKKFELRQGMWDSVEAILKQGEVLLSEHMFILQLTEKKTGQQFHILGAFPSQSGKTNMGMIEFPDELKDDFTAQLISDDLADIFMAQDPNVYTQDELGHLFAQNPEDGVFGVIFGTGWKSNTALMKSLKPNSGVIFTNVAVNRELREVWWEGKTSDFPPFDKYAPFWKDWSGKKIIDRQVSEEDVQKKYGGQKKLSDLTAEERWAIQVTKGIWAHENSRASVPMTNIVNLSPDFHNPKGVKIDAILWGGKTDFHPLLYIPYNTIEGITDGSSAVAQSSPAEEGKRGELVADPMAQRPFFGPPMGRYFAAWLRMAEIVGDKMPIIAHINQIQKSWPGYDKNGHPLNSLIKFIKGDRSDFQRSALGYVLRENVFDLRHFTNPRTKAPLTKDEFDQVRGYDPYYLLNMEMPRRRAYYDTLDGATLKDKVPQVLRNTNEKIAFRLANEITGLDLDKIRWNLGSHPVMETIDGQLSLVLLVNRDHPVLDLTVDKINEMLRLAGLQKYLAAHLTQDKHRLVVVSQDHSIKGYLDSVQELRKYIDYVKAQTMMMATGEMDAAMTVEDTKALAREALGITDKNVPFVVLTGSELWARLERVIDNHGMVTIQPHPGFNEFEVIGNSQALKLALAGRKALYVPVLGGNPSKNVFLDVRADQAMAVQSQIPETGTGVTMVRMHGIDPAKKVGTLRWGVLTSGGLAPHNPAIAELVKTAQKYSEALGINIEVVGIPLGWKGASLPKEEFMQQTGVLTSKAVEPLRYVGGSMLGSSRTNPTDSKNPQNQVNVINNLRQFGFNALIPMGGDDTLGGAGRILAAILKDRGIDNPENPEYVRGEFEDGMTPEALVSAIKQDVNLPSMEGANALDQLNAWLKDPDFYKTLLNSSLRAKGLKNKGNLLEYFRQIIANAKRWVNQLKLRKHFKQIIAKNADQLEFVNRQAIELLYVKESPVRLQFIGLPKTMDNDLMTGTANNYGFSTFVINTVRDLMNLENSAQGLHRFFIKEIASRNAGFTTLWTGAMVGAIRSFVPEEGEIDVKELKQSIGDYLERTKNSPYPEDHYGIFAISEGVFPHNDLEFTAKDFEGMSLEKMIDLYNNIAFVFKLTEELPIKSKEDALVKLNKFFESDEIVQKSSMHIEIINLLSEEGKYHYRILQEELEKNNGVWPGTNTLNKNVGRNRIKRLTRIILEAKILGIPAHTEAQEYIWQAIQKFPGIEPYFYPKGVVKTDAFGHPKLEGAGEILHAVLSVLFPKYSFNLASKALYEEREASPSVEDLFITTTVAKSAAKTMINGKALSGMALFVTGDKDKIASTPLKSDMGGRIAKFQHGNDPEYMTYISANRAFFSQRALVNSINFSLAYIGKELGFYNDSRKINNGDILNLNNYAQMRARLSFTQRRIDAALENPTSSPGILPILENYQKTAQAYSDILSTITPSDFAMIASKMDRTLAQRQSVSVNGQSGLLLLDNTKDLEGISLDGAIEMLRLKWLPFNVKVQRVKVSTANGPQTALVALSQIGQISEDQINEMSRSFTDAAMSAFDRNDWENLRNHKLSLGALQDMKTWVSGLKGNHREELRAIESAIGFEQKRLRRESRHNGSVDNAQLTTKGGIDLNTSNGMQWKVSKDGNGVVMDIDPAMIARIKQQGIAWLSPVIFKITPVTSVWPLLGLEEPAR